MKIEMTHEYTMSIPKGSVHECLMKIRAGRTKFLWLVDVRMGARTLDEDDKILYTSPLYDEARHKNGEYTWLAVNYVKEINLKNNQQAKHLLSKEEF